LNQVFLRTFWAAAVEKPDDLKARTLIQEGNRIFLDNVPGAIDKFEEAAKVSKSPTPYTKRAWAYLQLEDYETALEDVDKALEIDVTNVESHLCKASIHYHADENGKCLESLYMALDLTASNDCRKPSIEQFLQKCREKMRGGQPRPAPIPSNVPSFEQVNITVDPQANSRDGDGEEKIIECKAEPTSLPMGELEKLQISLQQKMIKMGGSDFFEQMRNMSEIPAVIEIQKKALKGETPSMTEYIALQRDDRFIQFALKLQGIGNKPELKAVVESLQAGDWLKAFKELDLDERKLESFMEGFKKKESAN